MTKKYKILNLYDAKRVLPAVPIDGDGQVLHEGDRVYSYDYDVETFAPQRFYGQVHMQVAIK